MRAKELVGKVAIRTAPIAFNGDRSYTNDPIQIIAVSDSHIKYKNYPLGSVEYLLGPAWLDDNWIDYERMFEPEVKEAERRAKVGEYAKIINADPSIEINGVPEYKNGDILKITHIDSGDRHYGPSSIAYLREYEYVVLENYQPEPYKVDWDKVATREIAEELVRRYS